MVKIVEILAFLLRPRRKTLIFLLVVIWLAISSLLYHNYQDRSNAYLEGSIYEGQDTKNPVGGGPSKAELEKQKIAKTKETIANNISFQMLQKQSNSKDIRNIEAHLSIYDIIFANHDVNSVLAHLSFEQRCDLYFTNLYTSDTNWYLNPDENLPLENRDEFKYADYKRKKTGELKEQIAKDKDIEKDDVKEDQEFEDKMKEKYLEFWRKTQKTEQTVVDYVSHLRIFNKCYVTRDNVIESDLTTKFIKKQQAFISALSDASPGANGENVLTPFTQSEAERRLNTDSFRTCSNIEGRLYPWLSMQYPTYERWTKEVFYSPPKMSKFVKDSAVHEPSNVAAHNGKGKGKKVRSKLTGKKNDCFVSNFKNSLNGKGIVLSIADQHVDDTVRQILLLRALNNKYPIQIVYNGGLSEDSKHRIVEAAREAFSSLPDSFKNVEKYFPSDYLDPKDHGLPKQEVWFVNVANVVPDKYKGKFGGFGNKFLAALFNSFEEYMLVDADTVMVQNPDFFFRLKNYKELGAYFYKDRAAPHFRPLADSTFFKKITPGVIDLVMFDIPSISKKSFDYEFFQGMFYYMESGLVMINRNLHFNSVMMMVQMNFFQTVSGRVYGDKEIFFLAFLTAGEENFYFNDYFAAAIGEETPMDERVDDKNPKTLLSKEICAAHPGHISAEDGKSLVWFNSGFRFCGQAFKVNYEKEFKEGRRYKSFVDQKQMETFYKNPATLKHAIVPPFKNKLETLAENVAGEPKEAWHMDTGYCNSYLWCAYDRIGGQTDKGDDNTQKGMFIEFDQKSVDLFSYYGDIWVGKE